MGGTLIEEFPAVCRTDTNGPRLIDGIIVLDGANRIAKASEIDICGKDIIVVQTKASRLNIYLIGQVIFSKELMKPFKPRSIRSVAVCTRTDSVLEPLLLAYDDVEIVVYGE